MQYIKEYMNKKKIKILNDNSLKSQNSDKNLKNIYIPTTLDKSNIPKKIMELRKNHKYLYQSDVQLICNYLDLFDSNKNLFKLKNLFFYSYAQIDYEIDKNNFYYYSKFINEKRCGELINKYLNISNCSYHQIQIFIKILAHQLKLFSNNYALMVETLYAGGIDRIIRINLINSIINLTQFFTKGAFDEIVEEQSSVLFAYDENLIKNITIVLSSKKLLILKI